MTIDKYVIAKKSNSPYWDKYENPLISAYSKHIPDSLIHGFYKQATLEEIALFFMGWHNRKPFDMPSILVSLERNGFFEVPIIEGILEVKYWENWFVNHLKEIIDQSRVFGKG